MQSRHGRYASRFPVLSSEHPDPGSSLPIAGPRTVVVVVTAAGLGFLFGAMLFGAMLPWSNAFWSNAACNTALMSSMSRLDVGVRVE